MSTRLSPDTRVERREFVLKSVTKDDWEAIVLKAVDQAKHGNSAARQWLADYITPAWGGPETDLKALALKAVGLDGFETTIPKPRLKV